MGRAVRHGASRPNPGRLAGALDGACDVRRGPLRWGRLRRGPVRRGLPQRGWGRVALVLAAALLLWGCEEGDGAPPAGGAGDTGSGATDRASGDDGPSLSERQGGGLAPEGFRMEQWPVGDRWYIYDGRTHTLTPREEVYLFAAGDAAVLIRVLGYYGQQGESGVFSLRWRTWDGAAWSAPQERMLDRNVKESQVCLSLVPFEEVACDAGDVGLVLRTNRRVLPAAGFVVANPGLFEAAHPAGDRVDVGVLPASSMDSPPSSPQEGIEAHGRPSAGVSLDEWLVGDRWSEPAGRVWLHATTNMHLGQWQALALEGDASRTDGLDLNVRCVPLASSPGEQQALGDVEPSRTALALGEVRSTLVRLCPEVEIVDEHDVHFQATWPDSRDYDLIVERHADGLWLRPSSGSLVMDWTGNQAQRPAAIEDVEPPASLWE